MAKLKKEEIIPIKTVFRLLSVKLTEAEMKQAGFDLANTCQEINAEEEHQKEIKDELKARMSELVARQSKLALRISKGQEMRDVQVKIEMHPSGQVSETRIDTGEVLILREAYEEEKQLPLGKQESAKTETTSNPEPESN